MTPRRTIRPTPAMEAAMRALLLSCLALVPVSAWSDVPVPAPNPFLANEPEAVETGCPEGSVPSGVALSIVEQHVAESGEAGAVVAGAMAGSMRAALATVTGKAISDVSSIIVLPVRGGDGANGQLWVLFAGLCSPSIAILPPHVAAAVWKQVGSTI